MKHKSVDYKLSAVNYHLNHKDGYDNTYKIFDCKKNLTFKSCKTFENLIRINRKSVSYKNN